MPKNLMIIESAGKKETIKGILSQMNISAQILSTGGHIKQLSSNKGGLGFDPNDLNDITWTIPRKKTLRTKTPQMIVKEIKLAANKANKIYIATDKDREGEGIAWHIYEVVGKENQQKCWRVIFNSVTRESIENSIENLIPINKERASAFFARRLLDRFIGFRLSHFISRYTEGISAGRVQSIALKFVKDRDDEIEKHIPDCWYSIAASYQGAKLILKKLAEDNKSFDLRDDIKNSTINFTTQTQAQEFVDSLEKFHFKESISGPNKSIHPPLPLKTSSLIAMAGRKLGMSPKVVGAISQKLYEGVVIDGKTIGLITYPRTDMCDYSNAFIEKAHPFIINLYSQTYWNQNPKFKSIDKDDSTQGAHEAIRPVDLSISPSTVSSFLDHNHSSLYKLIWTHTLISLMSPAVYKGEKYIFDNHGNIFHCNSSEVVFDGWHRLINDYYKEYLSDSTRVKLPLLQPGDVIKTDEIKVLEEHNAPPPLYTPLTLIAALEDKKIGRAGTYATYPDKLTNRGYVTEVKKAFMLTPLGKVVSNKLEEDFHDFINYEYTRNMDEQLKLVELGQLQWKVFLTKIISDFNDIYNKFDWGCEKCGGKIEQIWNKKNKKQTMICNACKKKDMILLEEECPKCFKKLSVKEGMYGEFTTCSGYPECKFKKQILLEEECPKCSKKLTEINSKIGKFLGCSGYPDCKYVKNDQPLLDKRCPQCQEKLRKRNGRFGPFISCSGYPECKYIEKTNTLDEECPQCSKKLRKQNGKFGPFISCSGYPECKYIEKNKK